MQVVLDIDDKEEETILTIIRNLKQGLVKKYTIHRTTAHHIPTVSKEEEAEILSSLESMSAEDRQIVSTSQYEIQL